MKKIFVLTIVAFVLASCSLFRSAVVVENDKIMNSRRIIYDMYFTNNKRYEQSYSQLVTVMKETDRNNVTTFTLYDVITLPVNSFEIDESRMYLIINDDVIPLTNTYKKQFEHRKISEKKDEIMKSDSTKVSVVTGYDVTNQKKVQMTHIIAPETMHKILEAREAHLRYYVGPNIINSEIKGSKLSNLKTLIKK